jgi:thiamine-monophosphate kinase
MTSDQQTLFDLGERRILREIVPRFVEPGGDDCASVILPWRQMVITTDPVPRPAAEVIGGDNDPFWLGWLLVTINASDIAASGARPEGFLAALDLPREYPVARFERLLKGIQSSCSANGLRYIGGNIREATALAAVGTAFGSSPKSPLGRRGARSGNHIVILGDGGRFWEDVFKHRAGQAVDKSSSPLFSPVSQADVVYKLHEANLLNCAMDTSDGLAPTLEELALVNNMAIEINISSFRRDRQKFEGAAGRPERFWFGWGDWTVVTAIEEDALPAVKRIMDGLEKPWCDAGEIATGPPEVHLVDNDLRIIAPRLESERFAPDSWFIQGIDEYIRRLEAYALP